MLGTERFLSDHQRPLVERLGVGISALAAVERSQVVQRLRDIAMVGTEGFLADRQRALEERLGLGVSALVVIDRSQVV